MVYSRLLLGRLETPRLLEVLALELAHARVVVLDLAHRREDLEVAEGAYREVETNLVVAHAGAAVRDRGGAFFFAGELRPRSRR